MFNVIAQQSGKHWMLYNADCVDAISALPSESIDFLITSPPYSLLYVYSASTRDMGNNRDNRGFFRHFRFLISHIRRVMKPGRIVAIDCMNIPMMKERDGFIGLSDFRGQLIRSFQRAGFIFHSEHCIWKDPLIEATRTKSIGLMHKQLCKDSAMCRSGLPQYLLGFRVPGVNANPIKHPHGLTYFVGENAPRHGNLSHERWRRYASPVWMDVDFGKTLNAAAARDGKDERHICPMALDIIERGIHLWSKEGDVVLDPFAGVGSSGVISLQRSRKFIGVELKESYFRQACANLRAAELENRTLFDAPAHSAAV